MTVSDGAQVRLRMLQTVNALVGGANQHLVAGQVYDVPLDAPVRDLIRGRYAELVEDAPAVQPGTEQAVMPKGRAKRG